MLKKFKSILLPNNGHYSHENRLAGLVGFTGSYGLAHLIYSDDDQLEKAYLFVDGRYTEQANRQVRKNVDVMDVREHEKWMSGFFKSGDVMGVDPYLHSVLEYQKYSNILGKNGSEIAVIDRKQVNAEWNNVHCIDPQLIIFHELQYSGKSSQEKLMEICCGIKDEEILLISCDQSIAWLFNLRRKYVNPGVPGICVVRKSGAAELFVDHSILSRCAELLDGVDGVRIANLCHFVDVIGDFASSVILLDYTTTNAGVFLSLSQHGISIKNSINPCILKKSIKNDAEIAGMKKAHVKDGIAVTKFIKWLENVKNANDISEITEIKCAEKILEFRKEHDDFICESFPTISSIQENSSIIHHAPTDRLMAKSDRIYLIDSGGHYINGTTDITRTVAIGVPMPEEKFAYTLVLKGHIAIARAVFRRGTTGAQIDILARQFLWQHGWDYDHSTGHGVGCFLNVHEGPQAISARSQQELLPGMVLSNEPGFYLPGKFGVRLENVVLVKECFGEDSGEVSDGLNEDLNEDMMDFLCFETISFAPFCHDLIDFPMMTDDEIEWLEGYEMG